MVYKIILVCAVKHIKHTSAICVQNVEFFKVNPGSPRSNHYVLKGSVE